MTVGTAQSTGTGSGRHLGRLALGMAVLATERLRLGPPGDTVLTSVGLLQQAASTTGEFARRVANSPVRLAARADAWMSVLPPRSLPRRTMSSARTAMEQMVTGARRRGAFTIAAGRREALAVVDNVVHDSITWAQDNAVPQIVDALVPHLVQEVVPQILEGVMPEIRSRVLPVVIDELTHDPQVRDLVLEQGRGAVGEAAEHLRSTTATADDRVESAFRKLVRGPSGDG